MRREFLQVLPGLRLPGFLCSWHARPGPVLAAVVVGVLACAPAMPQSPPGEVPTDFSEQIDIRVGFVRVAIPGGGEPLRAEELEVEWKGKRQNLIRVVGGEAGSLEVGIAVDQSASMQGSFESMRAEVLRFVDRNVAEEDRVFLVAFADQLRSVAEGRSEVESALRDLPALEPGGSRPTAFFASLDHVLDRFENAPSRAALIVASDGCDSTDQTDGALRVSRRAAEMAIPILLLSPGRGECRNTSCTWVPPGKWKCTPGAAPTLGWWTQETAASPGAKKRELQGVFSTSRATNERDRFLSLVKSAGGSLSIARTPEQWQDALDSARSLLAQQWTLVFEPSSSGVRSDEVKVFRTVAGRRRRIR